MPGVPFGTYAPMHPVRADEPFDSPTHAFEPKLDGVRALAYADGDGDGDVRLQLRSGREATNRYPEVVDAVRRLLVDRAAVLDGEICALDPRGVPELPLLMTRENATPDRVRDLAATHPVVYYVFDVLSVDGEPVLTRPWETRKALLDDLLRHASGTVRVVRPLPGDGRRAYRAALDAGLEGIVAKRRDAPYRPGSRSDDWTKVKRRDLADVVVGGWTLGEGSLRGTLGALVVGAYDDDVLVPLGKVGTGLSHAERRALADRLASLARDTTPFSGGPTPPGTRFVRPELVVEVAYHEVTKDRKLRAPRVVRVRPDKPPAECLLDDVTRTAPAPPPR